MTRACRGYPHETGKFALEDALYLLRKKLHGVNESTQNVVNASWKKQILHIFVPAQEIANLVHEAYNHVEECLRANTVVIICVCAGAVTEIFKQRASAQVLKRKKTSLGLKSDEHLANLANSDPCR